MLEVPAGSYSSLGRDYLLAKQSFQLDYSRGTHKTIRIIGEEPVGTSFGVDKIWMQYTENIIGFKC